MGGRKRSVEAVVQRRPRTRLGRSKSVASIPQLRQRHLQLAAFRSTQRDLHSIHCRHHPLLLHTLAIVVQDERSASLEALAVEMQQLTVAVEPDVTIGIAAARGGAIVVAPARVAVQAAPQLVACNRRAPHAVVIDVLRSMRSTS
eukprot:6213744-Pleurochrysis_carterae.AAC.2